MHLSQFGIWVEPDSWKLFCLKPNRLGNREQTAAAAGRGKAAATFFYWSSCNFGRDFRQNQFSCHQHYVQTIFMKELLHPSTTNIIQIQSISPSTRHRIEPFILQVNNHLQNALCLRKKLFWPWSKTSLLVLYLWSLKKCPCYLSSWSASIFISLLILVKVVSLYLPPFAGLRVAPYYTRSPLEAQFRRVHWFPHCQFYKSYKVFCNKRIDRSIKHEQKVLL